MSTTEDRPLLLRGGAFFESETRTFVRGDVLCVEGRIVALGDVAAPEGAEAVDCSDEYLIPGLIDCHVHISSSGDPAELTPGERPSLARRAWRTAEHARATLAGGVTTVRDLGAADRLNVDLAKAVEAGDVEGPRVVAAGMGVTMSGGHGHGFIAREADGPDEVRKAVREEIREGATAIKLFASGGVLTPGVNPRSPAFTREELTAGVEEATKAFRTVAAHAQSTVGIKNAVAAGVSSIEHGVWLDEEAIAMMIERGTYLVPTLTAPYHIASGAEAGIPAYAVEKGQAVLEDHFASYERALAAGVRVAMGTDQGTPLNRPGENAQEAVRMADHGLSPGAALLAATGWAADLLGLDEETGRLRVGLAADIVRLSEDPLTDIRCLTRPAAIAGVVRGGKPVGSTGGTV
ncbi:MAG: amidohydrolase family protein [Chloroflexi bacterium]|nr:amidohydrolase family protein [Chloroflexota bacterium]